MATKYDQMNRRTYRSQENKMIQQVEIRETGEAKKNTKEVEIGEERGKKM